MLSQSGGNDGRGDSLCFAGWKSSGPTANAFDVARAVIPVVGFGGAGGVEIVPASCQRSCVGFAAGDGARAASVAGDQRRSNNSFQTQPSNNKTPALTHIRLAKGSGADALRPLRDRICLGGRGPRTFCLSTCTRRACVSAGCFSRHSVVHARAAPHASSPFLQSRAVEDLVVTPDLPALLQVPVQAYLCV